MRVRGVRPYLLLWHRWFGLLAGVWLMVLSLTGVVLVFEAELDRTLNPALLTVLPGPRHLDIGIREATRRFPDRYVFRAYLPDGADGAAELWMMARPGRTASGALLVYVDPSNGRLLGSRIWGEPGLDRRRLVLFVYSLHRGLLWPPLVWLLGLVAFGWLLDHAVGVVLAFPSPRQWRRSFAVRPRARNGKLIFDLHRAGGLWLLPITFVLAATGLEMNWPAYVDPILAAVLPSTPSFAAERRDRGEKLAVAPTGFEQVAVIGEAKTGLHLHRILYDATTATYTVELEPFGDVSGVNMTEIRVDGRSGAVLSVQAPATRTASDTIRAWILPLHSGEVLGWPGRTAVLIAGLMTLTLTGTGLAIWARRRAARRRVRQRPRG